MDDARVTEAEPLRVVRRWYRGARPPAAEFFAHWRDFTAWARSRGLASPRDDIRMVGYEPPGAAGLRDFVYAACIPVADGIAVDAGEDAEVAWLPGGRFVLCAGDLPELPDLYRAAKRFAAAQGLPYERGGFEFFRPHPDAPKSYRLDAGYRIHD